MTNNNDSRNDVKKAVAAAGLASGIGVAFVVIQAGRNHLESYETLIMLETKKKLRQSQEGGIPPETISIKPEPWAVVVTHPIGLVSTVIIGAILGAFIAYKIANRLIIIIDALLANFSR